MAGFKTFVAGEILTAADVNSFLMSQAISVFADATARNAAITSPVEGQFVFRKDDDVLEYWDGSAWEEFSTGLPNAEITGTTGSPTTGTFTDANGFDWTYYQWTGAGSITVGAAGYADLLVVGGGGASGSESSRTGGGGAGVLRWGQHYVPSGTHTITIGAGGTGEIFAGYGNNGSSSSLGTVMVSGGGTGGRGKDINGNINVDGGSNGGMDGGMLIISSTTGTKLGGGAGPTNLGLSLDYTGTAVEYSRGGYGTAPVANTGGGGRNTGAGQAGAAGVVIVKVPA